MDSEQRLRHGAGTGNATMAPRARRGPGRTTPSETKLRNLELLDKALDLFLEKGFERTTIDGITASVGMAKRTVYLRYGNKSGLFKASLQRAIEEWIVPVERLRSAETDNAEETLLRIGRILVANMMSPAGLRLLRITNAESGRMPEIGAFSYRQGTGPTISYLTDLIRRRVRPGGIEVAEPAEAAMAFLNLVVGGPANITAWGVALDDAAIDNHTRYSVNLFLHGLLHPGQGLAVGSGEAARRRGMRKPAAQSPQPETAAQDARSVAGLEEENRRLKVLLAESMLEVAALRERSGPR